MPRLQPRSRSCRCRSSNNWYGQYNASRFGLVETAGSLSAIAPAYRGGSGQVTPIGLRPLTGICASGKVTTVSVYLKSCAMAQQDRMAATPLRVWARWGAGPLAFAGAGRWCCGRAASLLLRNRRLRQEHARMQAIPGCHAGSAVRARLGRPVHRRCMPPIRFAGRAVERPGWGARFPRCCQPTPQVVLAALHQAHEAGYSSGMTFALTLPGYGGFELSVARKVRDHAARNPLHHRHAT